MAKIAGVYASIRCTEENGKVLLSVSEESAENCKKMVYIEGNRESALIFARDERVGDSVWVRNGKSALCIAECILDEKTNHAKWELGASGTSIMFLNTQYWERRLQDGTEIIFSSDRE